jgi:tRNA (adenine57-N1/adenine58-N1)-methyltransferase
VKPLEAGERVLLQDVKGRRYLITLEQGATFHTHKGRLAHDQLIGAAEGTVARTDLGQKLLALRPTLADWVVKMPRGAQVIYPKVLALMVMAADVQPGMTVAEAGAGSGALSIALLQALAPAGGCTPSSAAPTSPTRPGATSSAGSARPPTASSSTRATWSTGIGRARPRRPGPARPAGAVAGRARAPPPPWLRAGCWSASWPPCPRSCAWSRPWRGSGGFGLVETSEAIFRPWHVDGLAVRPEHRMIGHTGFLVSARRVDGPWPSPGRVP